MEKNLIGAPWKKSNSLGEMVKAESGDLVAVVYGRTADERKARTALIEHAPAMRNALKDCSSLISRLHHGPEEVSSHEVLGILDGLGELLREAEPV